MAKKPIPTSQPAPATPESFLYGDEHDGQGGSFAIIDGQRVRVDEDGNPLTDEQPAAIAQPAIAQAAIDPEPNANQD